MLFSFKQNKTKQNKTKQKALSPFFQIFYGNVATSQK
jgi:hypothetical protein